jgi:hypothetical protein
VVCGCNYPTIKITQQTMSDTIEVYETYFECIGLGKGKNKEWKCRGCHQRWTCPVTKLRATSFKVQGKDTRLCTKTYSSQEVETMQLLETKIAEVSMHRRSSAWRTRVTLHRLHLPHNGLALHNSHAPLPPHLHARTPLCLRKGSSPFLALCFRKGSSPFLAWPLRNDTIKQTCSSACFSMAAASPSTCHAVLCLSVHCRAWLRLGLALSLSSTTLCVAVCWTRCAMGTLLQQSLVFGGVKRRGR